ncbi:hypothetical protein PYW08_013942 [Mythimna loreyi]|uniref:Uncharacterized protein n=1 Tax=Mythimna loreyi TaxID=667449 RepID=A0ACC2R6J8_9NEOP|nr:hypothetical protein PYW08_013942 [Mythimna loreyi]
MLSKILISLTVIVFLLRFKSVVKSELIKLKFHLKMSLYYVLLTLTSMIVMPFLLFRPKHHSNGLFTANLMKHITKIYGLEWHIRNGEILAEDRGAVIISNHQSVLDIAGFNNAWYLARKLYLIVKREVIWTGPLGIVTYLCGSIFIDRQNPKEANKILERTKQIMTEDKIKIWIFPEGTRNRNWNGKLLPFKKGAFNIAVRAQVPILPVVYSPYYFIDNDKYVFNKGHVILQCLEPVSTKGLTLEDVPALTERLHQIMSRAFEQLSKEVQSTSPMKHGQHTKLC